jgi:GT2 family glycosyltransferase
MPMNTDVVLDPRFVGELVVALEKQGAGSASGKLIRFPPGEQDGVIDTVGHVLFNNRLAQPIASSRKTQAIQVFASKRCIRSCQFTLPV